MFAKITDKTPTIIIRYKEGLSRPRCGAIKPDFKLPYIPYILNEKKNLRFTLRLRPTTEEMCKNYDWYIKSNFKCVQSMIYWLIKLDIESFYDRNNKMCVCVCVCYVTTYIHMRKILRHVCI